MIEYRDTSPPADLGPLARLFDRVGWQSRTRDPERFAKMVRGSDFHVFAYDGEILVGYARAISDGAFSAYVGSVAVLREYQRQGIGRELVRRLVDGRDHLTFVLHADPVNHPFYLRCGFSLSPEMFRRKRSG
ncbi:MAG: GNAT family N-acetyltransferase [Polyangiaceae bacterium]|jgi:GNAT superfamily N-acetyltransferase